ncbi:hypothetical protein [Legionella maioricensis]|uniref:Uncharacterized protein n=1 Tax=Legionella maioricensis TaxID=2896528 RepID=A0A9X2IE81_9GAMM|nr:hypothetical protein [Legionella maioricensis]MCL9685553.1 hypothetical protein [Legionella maioricensis]MCL9688887.1 hypothetical protein [Legionella maioricensis]
MNNKSTFFHYSNLKSKLLPLPKDKKRKHESDSESSSSMASPNLSNSGSPFIIGTPIVSETTSTESMIDEYISINGNQLVRIIDMDTKEAVETKTHRKFFVSTGGELFYNRTEWHAHSLKTTIELTVCGGNFYALLMGEGQPEYFVGKGEVDEDLEDDVEPIYYRMSSKIDFLAEGEDIFSLNKPVKSLIFSLMISFFLGDPDVSNVVGVAEDEDVLIRRLDPEFCFSQYFSSESYNNYSSVLKELDFLFHLNTDNHELTADELQNRVEKSGVDFFRQCFMKKFLMHPDCLKILNSETRTNEFLSALKKITETPFDQYENIINKSISDENIRMQLKDTLKKRLGIFSQIYQELAVEIEPTKDAILPKAPAYRE